MKKLITAMALLFTIQCPAMMDKDMDLFTSSAGYISGASLCAAFECEEYSVKEGILLTGICLSRSLLDDDYKYGLVAGFASMSFSLFCANKIC